jgi:4-amino-4-deoxy-L-arabinose transferase-like glycosyltransferase
MSDESGNLVVDRTADARGGRQDRGLIRVNISPLFKLGLLSVLAGAIRFFHLGHPALWYDESMVFRRTCGSYGQLLDCLRTDGFVPLHYSLVWVVSRFFTLTPVVLRFFPALCGTLMVPAVYFLGRQLAGAETALLAAVFTACSAFMLFYSRDAKMYMEAWLFVTLSSGCVIWWFRRGSLTAWLCWVASGCCACGLHASSAIPIAVSLLLLLTQSKMHWRQMLFWLAGMGLIVAGPIGYYEKFNRWEDNVDEMGWKRSQLEWIAAYNYGRTGPELARFLGTTFLMGWEWPKDADLHNIPPARMVWPERAAEVLLVIFAAAALPWPERWKSSTVVLSVEAGGGAGVGSGPEPQWRLVLWLCFWILLPTYGFYCRSMGNFETPGDWLRRLVEAAPALRHDWFWVFVSGMVLFVAWLAGRFVEVRPKVVRGLALLVVGAAVLGVMQVVGLVMRAEAKAAIESGKPWVSLWVPRYLGFVWPMLAIAAAGLLLRLPTRGLRWAAICFVLGLNCGVGSLRIFGQTEPPVDRMAADAYEAEKPGQGTVFWAHLRPSRDAPGGANIYGEPGEYYSQLLEKRVIDPVLFRRYVQERRRADFGLRRMPWDQPMGTETRKILFWSEYNAQGKVLAVEPTVPSNWKLVSDEWFVARDCWIWEDVGEYRRSVYVRVGE